MCESNVYIKEGNKEEELFFENVSYMTIKNSVINISDLFGNRKEVYGHVEDIDFMKHKITVIIDKQL